MSARLLRQTLRHSRLINAPAQTLYLLVAHVTRWPAIFEPCVDARFIRREKCEERIAIRAGVNGTVRSWLSHRSLDARSLRIDFRQEHTGSIASMCGYWFFRPRGRRTEAMLVHEFCAQTGSELKDIAAAVDANSNKELAALARVAEQPLSLHDTVFSFTDVVRVPVAADTAYEFLARSDRWPSRLPHVGSVDLQERAGGVQEMTMDTVTGDGRRHTTTSIRVCSAPSEIVYKQIVPPAGFLGHSGAWNVRPAPDGCLVVARHTVVLDSSTMTEVIDSPARAAQTRRRVRDLLSANSRATLAAAAAATPLATRGNR